MADHLADYSVHKTLAPNVVDHVTLTLGIAAREERFQIGAVTAVITNRSPTLPLYFDFTYSKGGAMSDQTAPISEITPERDNSFVVMPEQSWCMTPRSVLPLDFVLVADGAVPYSVMVYY